MYRFYVETIKQIDDVDADEYTFSDGWIHFAVKGRERALISYNADHVIAISFAGLASEYAKADDEE